jgi:hypothetical protein
VPENVKNRDAALSPNVVVAAIVALTAIAAAIAAGALIAGVSSETTPIVTSVLGLVAPTVVGLLALVKAEKVDRKTDAVNDKVDGHLARLTAIATTAAAASGDPALVKEADKTGAVTGELVNGGDA